jgi:hypothetical protein
MGDEILDELGAENARHTSTARGGLELQLLGDSETPGELRRNDRERAPFAACVGSG